MEIHFEAQTTRQELLRVFKLNLAFPFWFKILYFPLLAFCVWNFVPLIRQGDILFAILNLLIITYPFSTPYLQVAQASRRTPRIFEPYSGMISEEGVSFQSKETDDFIAWSKYVKIKRNENLILLYYPNRAYDHFQRSYFASKADWDAFMAWIDRKLAEGTLRDILAKPTFSFLRKR